MLNQIIKVLMLTTLILSNGYAYTAVEDALLSDTEYTISGTFGKHNFADADAAFDWAFTTNKGISYQLQGKPPSENDVFGWEEVNIATPDPAWYMFQLNGDIDGDSTIKFDWILASTNMNKKSMYKLTGVSDSGNFEYSSKLDIDYRVFGNIIQTGAVGSFDSPGSSTVLSLIVGQTLYSHECDDTIDIYTFQANGMILLQDDEDEYLVPYRIEGDTLYVTVYYEEEAYILLEHTSDYIKFDESDEKTGTLYFDKTKAEAALPENCVDGSLENYIPVTQEMLSGVTLYKSSIEDQDTIYYSKVSFSTTTITGHGLSVNQEDGSIEEDETWQQSYVLENGQMKTESEDGIELIILNSIEDNRWHITFQIDENGDGNYDVQETVIFYLSKPVGFPDNL